MCILRAPDPCCETQREVNSIQTHHILISLSQLFSCTCHLEAQSGKDDCQHAAHQVTAEELEIAQVGCGTCPRILSQSFGHVLYEQKAPTTSRQKNRIAGSTQTSSLYNFDSWRSFLEVQWKTGSWLWQDLSSSSVTQSPVSLKNSASKLP